MQLKDRVSRHLKLHDLRVLMAVAETGSMRKAASVLEIQLSHLFLAPSLSLKTLSACPCSNVIRTV